MIFGIGVDIIEISRVEKALQRTSALRDSVFTKAEIAYCSGKKKPAQSYAVCFAAKEAVFKALRLHDERPAWQEIELLHDEQGLPYLSLNGKIAELAAERKITAWHISCSHSDSQAIAYVIAEQELKED